MSFIWDNLLYLLLPSAILTGSIYFNFPASWMIPDFLWKVPLKSRKSQRDVLMLLSLVLYCHSIKIKVFSRLLGTLKKAQMQQYFGSDTVQGLEMYVPFMLLQTLILRPSRFRLYWIAIWSQSFFCLLAIWLWTLMCDSIYLYALYTFYVVNTKGSKRLQRPWGLETAWCELPTAAIAARCKLIKEKKI